MPYRQKWLAWRLAEAGNPIKAHTLLQCLPASSLTDNDEARASRIRERAIKASEAAARKQPRYLDKKNKQAEVVELRQKLEQFEKIYGNERRELQRVLAELKDTVASDKKSSEQTLKTSFDAFRHEFTPVMAALKEGISTETLCVLNQSLEKAIQKASV